MQKENEPQVGSNFLGKTVSRRAFLGSIGRLGALAAASSACGGIALGRDKAVPSATLPVELPTPVDIKPSKERVIDLDGAQVYLNSEGLPEAYLGQDGVIVNFNVDEARKARDLARINGEEEVFKMFRVDVEHLNITTTPADFSEKHPVEAYLPKDTLTDAELKKRGIEIIQSDYTELHIREGAFRDGELLSGYKDGKRKLIFVMIDEEVVSRHYLKDPKFNSVRELAAPYEDVDVEGLREKMVKGYNSEIDLNRKSLKDYGSEEYYLSILDLKTFIYHTQHLMSAKELLDVSIRSAQLKSKDHQTVLGQYHQDTYDDKGNMTSPAVIFVAMGEPPKSRDYLRIYFDKKGETVVDNFVNRAEGSDVALSDLQALPGPNDIGRRSYINEAQDTYILDPDWPGVRIRHEASHNFLMADQKEPASEYGADEEVIATFKRARDEFDRTGDNSGYYFVLRSKKTGEVILTEADEEPSSDQIAA